MVYKSRTRPYDYGMYSASSARDCIRTDNRTPQATTRTSVTTTITMSALQTYEYPGWGAIAGPLMGYTQAVRVESRIICSGQGGWANSQPDLATAGPRFPSDIGEEIDQAFRNVESNLRFAGGQGIAQAYKVLTLSTDIPSQHDHIVRNLKDWFPDRMPTWTELGVSHLGGGPPMRFEIEVEAYDPEGAAKERAKQEGGK